MWWRPTALDGVLLIELRRHADDRGWFCEAFNAADFARVLHEAGQPPAPAFVQDNESLSAAGVLRGLHHQRPPAAQGRLVRVTQGRAFDVTVDLRDGRWQGVELAGDRPELLWIPPGFAHGFLALEDATRLAYKVTAPYDPAAEVGIRWDDPALGIRWPLAPGQRPRLSARDAAAPGFVPAGPTGSAPGA
jgi:dTDP-4-dehydrorhamnose 3,5-epimerase